MVNQVYILIWQFIYLYYLPLFLYHQLLLPIIDINYHNIMLMVDFNFHNINVLLTIMVNKNFEMFKIYFPLRCIILGFFTF
mmetsp:Transcript_12426/g.1124  ORF Transcript_12426/g.1124 Transcript_12426/m.1124 type:complete len:81 (-) Transcript_12426:49-291(-)